MPDTPATSMETLAILSMTCSEFEAAVRARHGGGPEAAIAAYRHVFRTGTTTFADLPAFAAAPALATALATQIHFPRCEIAARYEAAGVLKFSTRLPDAHVIESVLIPDKQRLTLCVSSQVGCRMGCRFCITGEMGILRNLTPEEIVWQVYAARFLLNRPVDNIVFMGMGEPMDNLPAVIQALHVLRDQRGLNIACRSITVSTAGHVDGIRQLATHDFPNLRLAVSIHAANDQLRTKLMPINVRYPLARLKEALRDYPLGKSGVILVEYVLLAGVNDSETHARELASYLDGLRVRINVIPYNGGSSVPFTTPTREQVDAFCGWLSAAGLFVKRRHPRGRSIMAACGQLGRRDTALSATSTARGHGSGLP